jgi:hypothetical protein
MNRFLIAALLLLLVALSMVVGAFLYVQFLLVADTPTTTEGGVEVVPGDDRVEEAASDPGPNDTVEPSPALATPRAVRDSSIPLSSLPLSDTQKSLLAGAGIDYDTFIITPEMITCAEGKLGAERFDAIVGGSSPSALETMSLLGCL